MASQQNKKMRKANFSHREVMVMLENILENKRTIMSSICSDLTNKDKSKVWQMIAETLSSLGTTTRTSDEVREKFYNLKREHRARASVRHKTGNGGVIAKPYDDILNAIVGKDTELVKGVKGGGHDVFKDRQTFACSESCITDITPTACSTTRRGYAGPHKNDCLPVSFSVPEAVQKNNGCMEASDNVIKEAIKEVIKEYLRFAAERDVDRKQRRERN